MVAEDSCLVQVVLKRSVRDFIAEYVAKYGGTVSSFIRDSVTRDVYILTCVHKDDSKLSEE